MDETLSDIKYSYVTHSAVNHSGIHFKYSHTCRCWIQWVGMLSGCLRKTQPLREALIRRSGLKGTCKLQFLPTSVQLASLLLLLCHLSNVQSMREQLDSLGLCFDWDRVGRKWRTGPVGSVVNDKMQVWLWLFPTGSDHLSSGLLQMDTVSVHQAVWSRTGLPERGNRKSCDSWNCSHDWFWYYWGHSDIS